MNDWNKIRVLMVGSACLMLAVLLAGSCLQTDHEKAVMDGLAFVCTVEGREISLGLWENEGEERYYLFLPSCFAGKSGGFVLRYKDSMGTVRIDGAAYKDGDVWQEAGNEEIHQISIGGPWGRAYMDKTLQVLTSQGLPAVLFTVEGKDDVLDLKEFSNKRYMETGEMVMLSEKGELVCQEKLERFKLRGNLTAALDKKPLTFSFYEPVGLCGMAPAVKWNLLANATDGSYIRNKIVLDLANESISAYEPDGEFVEVYLNGIYQGQYLLTEAVQLGENRIEISPESSWFLEMELDFRLEEDAPYVITDRGQIFAIHSEAGVSYAEKERIRSMVNDIESALFSADGVSALSGKALGELIDLESWAEAFLVQEISGDHDTGIASQFAYAVDKEEPLLYAGPVWDFDGAMGNVNTAMFTNPEALTASIEQSRPEGNANQNRWFAAMYQNGEFRAVVEEKYRNIFRGKLEEILQVKVDEYVEKISRSAALDAFRWHERRLEWMFVLPDNLTFPETNDDGGYDYSCYLELGCHVDMVRDFLVRKKDFLDKLWIDHADFCIVEVRNNFPWLNQDYNQTIYYWVERGTPLKELPRYEGEDVGAYEYVDRRTGERVPEGTVIREDCVLEGIWEQ